jgi:MoxR-like ATPase
VADYTVSTNLISYIPAQFGIFGWPANGREAEVIRGMRVGDVIVPKFAQYPVAEKQEAYQRGIAAVFDTSWEEQRHSYDNVVNGGAGAVPFLMEVVALLSDDDAFPSKEPWARVAVDLQRLDHPLSTSEYLRLRVIPVELAGQFKAMAAPNRHIQSLPYGAAATIARAGAQRGRGPEYLRRESLVHAPDQDVAQVLLTAAGLGPDPLDRMFLVDDDGMAGLYVVDEGGSLRSSGEPIAVRPGDLRPLFEEARRKATDRDAFRPARAFDAADQLTAFLASDADILPIPEFPHFHDRYVILPRKVTEALELSRRPEPVEALPLHEADGGEDEEPDAPIAVVTLEQLQGLSVEAVEAALPPEMRVPRKVLAEAVTAVRSGKHLLFSGPPGTGKSTIATAVCHAVVGTNYRVATATADWTTFDTIGGYLPEASGKLGFEPGIVLRCLEAAEWLVIDELNRADIDKAFGPLFTLLAGSGTGQETVLLPYRRNEKHIEIAWDGAKGAATADYTITNVWRLFGTMNVTDKASLYQLSFAFLRRFAVIDVPLPDPAAYRELIAEQLTSLADDVKDRLADAAMVIAYGPIALGPAILLDIATFTRRGLIESSTLTAPYSDPLSAFLTAVRLYAVPQYEGADSAQRTTFVDALHAAIGDPPPEDWAALTGALDHVVG